MGNVHGSWLEIAHLGKTPARPVQGRTSLYVRKSDGHVMILSYDGTEIDLTDLAKKDPDVTSLRTRRHAQLSKDPGSTTSSAVGYGTTPSWSAGAFTKRLLTNADDATGPWLSFATSDVIGDAYGPSHLNTLRPGWQPEVTCQIRTDPTTVTYTRLWVGLFSADPSASTTPSVHLAAFRFNSLTDYGGTWRAVTAAGTPTQTVTDTAIPVTPDTAYRVRINLDGNQARFYMDDKLVTAHTTDLPPTGQLMGWAARITTLTDARRSISWSRTSLMHV